MRPSSWFSTRWRRRRWRSGGGATGRRGALLSSQRVRSEAVGYGFLLCCYGATSISTLPLDPTTARNARFGVVPTCRAHWKAADHAPPLPPSRPIAQLPVVGVEFAYLD